MSNFFLSLLANHLKKFNNGHDRGECCLSEVFFALITCWHERFSEIYKGYYTVARILWILFSSGKTIFYDRAQRVSKILLLPRENKIYIFKPPGRAVHSGGAKGAVAPARKTKCFFSNIVSDFAGLFLVAILVRNLTKTEFAPADKKS